MAKKSSGLTMSTATYGRDTAGRKKLEADFAASIINLKKTLNGSKYTDLVKLVKANWVGADATDFLNDLAREKNQVAKKVAQLEKYFVNATGADAKQFSKFQAGNVK